MPAIPQLREKTDCLYADGLGETGGRKEALQAVRRREEGHFNREAGAQSAFLDLPLSRQELSGHRGRCEILDEARRR